MYVLRIVRLVPAQPTQDQDEWPLQPQQTQVSGTQHWLISRLVPPWPVTDDEVLPNATNFGLDDDVNASALMAQIAQPLVPASVVFGDDDGLFFISIDDDSYPPNFFLKPWLFTYPNAAVIDDDPWTPFSTLGWDDEFWLTFPPIKYTTAPATLDDEVLANAVNIAVEEDFWSPIFTMTIVNVLMPVATTDSDVWVPFVPPPPSKAKGLPTVGVGS